MKTPPLKRDEHGQYPGSIGGEHELSSQETRRIREVLSRGPKFVSQIASECDIPMTNPTRLNALCQYINHLDKNTREVEMIWQETRRGARKFVGWQLTEHGQKMLELS
jgi:hypothetical protein